MKKLVFILKLKIGCLNSYEGINRIIKIVKNRASGYRTLNAFIDMIYLTLGDVNIPEQIPARFRTL